MCIGGRGPKQQAPVIAPVLPEAPDSSKRVEVTKNDDDKRMRAGQAGTIKTGNRGLLNDSANTYTPILGG